MLYFFICGLLVRTKKQKDKIRLFGVGINVAICFFFETILLCARMNYLLHIGEGSYTPTLTSTNVLVWLGPEYFNVGPHTLAKNHCPTDLGGNDYRGTPAPAGICSFWFLSFSADIMNYDYEKFSAGLALVYYILLQYFTILLKTEAERVVINEEVTEKEAFMTTLRRFKFICPSDLDKVEENHRYEAPAVEVQSEEKRQAEDVPPVAKKQTICETCTTCIYEYSVVKLYRYSVSTILGTLMKSPVLLLCLIISCQQALCLLPLTSLEINPYCAHLQVPLSQQKTMCLYKWTAGAIPFGLPLACGGSLVARVAYFILKKGRKSGNALVVLFAGCIILGAAMIVGVGMSLVVIWLFAGIPFGIWFRFAGIQNSILQQDHLTIECMAVLVPYTVFFILDVIQSILCTPAVDE